jgi:hypothetical protein
MKFFSWVWQDGYITFWPVIWNALPYRAPKNYIQKVFTDQGWKKRCVL